MHIHSEERIRALAIRADNLPLRNERLAASSPGLVSGVDAAGVELEGWARKNFVCIEGATWVICGLSKAEERRVVQVGSTNVTAGGAAVLVVGRRDVDEGVAGSAGRGDSCSERREGEVGGGDVVVGRAIIVLDLLEEHEVWGVEVLDDVRCDGGQVGALGPQVLDVVGTEGEAIAFAL